MKRQRYCEPLYSSSPLPVSLKPKERKLLSTFTRIERGSLKGVPSSNGPPVVIPLQSKIEAARTKVLKTCLQLLITLNTLSPRYVEVFSTGRDPSQAELDYLNEAFWKIMNFQFSRDFPLRLRV